MNHLLHLFVISLFIQNHPAFHDLLQLIWDKGYPLYKEKFRQAFQDTSSNASGLTADELEKSPEVLKQIAEGRHPKDIKVILMPLRSSKDSNIYTHTFIKNNSFSRTAHLGVHHMNVPQEGCLSVRLQDFCSGVHLLNQGSSGNQILTQSKKYLISSTQFSTHFIFNVQNKICVSLSKLSPPLSKYLTSQPIVEQDFFTNNDFNRKSFPTVCLCCPCKPYCSVLIWIRIHVMDPLYW